MSRTDIEQRAMIKGLSAMLDEAICALLRIGYEGPARDEMERAALEALRELGIEEPE